ncbi:MAG TPA: hypothetical protein VFB58_01600 [Chloroflexota bacterium]|nr:hypothetical protein [Chloroflexota bacterium]
MRFTYLAAAGAVAAGSALFSLRASDGLAAHKHHHHRRHRSSLIPGRPAPREETYKRCGPWGNGGDSVSNYLRNRIDPATRPHHLTFRQFIALDVPKGVATTPMKHWPAAGRRRVYRHEGMAASLEGYITTLAVGPKEPANCMGKAGYDWHIRLGRSPGAPERSTIITEATPRVRARERGFSLRVLDRYRRKHVRVRITGWLFLDNDHSTDLDRQRATLWEIHPVTRIQVWDRGHWRTIAG